MSGTSAFTPGRKGEKQIPQMPRRDFILCVCMRVCVCCEFDRGGGAVVEKVAADLLSDKTEKPGKGDIPGGLGAAFRHEHPTHTCLRSSPHDSTKE